MAEKKDEIQKRAQILGKHLKKTCKNEKIKYALLSEYKLGNFFSIPQGLFDLSNPDDVGELDKLKEIYLKSLKENQVIPDGLFDLSDEVERKKLRDSIQTKQSYDVIFDLTYIPKGLYSEEEYEDLVDFNITLSILKDEKKLNDNYIYKYLEEYKVNQEEFKKRKDEFNRKKLAPFLVRKKSVGNEPIKFSKIKYLSNSILQPFNVAKRNAYIEKNLSSYDFETMFKFKYYNKFRKIELHAEMEEEEKLDRFFTEKFFLYKQETDIFSGTIDDKQKENLENQKKIITDVLEKLTKTGCLDSLIKIENEKTKKINEFLPEECSLPILNKDMIYQDIQELDMSNPKDIIKFYVFGRQILNKLAHNYKDIIYFELKNNTIRNDEYEFKLYKKTNEILTYIKEYVEEHSVNKKQITIDKNTKLYNQIRKMTDSEKKCLKMCNGYIKQYIRGEDLRNKIKSDIVNSKYYKKRFEYENIDEYVWERMNGLFELKENYNNFIRKNKQNSRAHIQTFEELFCKVIDGNLNKENYANFVIKDNDTSINLIDKIKKYIEEIEQLNYIKNPSDVLKKIVRRMEMEDKIFKAKQFFTESLLDINQKKPGMIRIEFEENAGSEKNGGVFDIYLPGMTQVFGGHFEKGEFDLNDSRIKALPKVCKSVTQGFKENENDLLSLHVLMPITKELTAKQIKVFKDLQKTIDSLEKNKNDSSLYQYDKLKKLKQENSDGYENLKIRIALGAGLEMYKRKIAFLTSSYVSSYSAATYMLQDEYEGIFIKDGDYETPYTINGDSETPFTTNGDSETSYTINGNYETPYTINDDIKNEFPKLTPRQIKYANDILNDINEGKTIEEIIEEDGIIDEKILLCVEMIRKKGAEERDSLSEIKTNRLKSMKTKIIKAMRKTNTISYR